MKVRFVSKMKKHGRKYLWVHRLMMIDAQLVLVAAVILLQQEKGENEMLSLQSHLGSNVCSSFKFVQRQVIS